MKSKNIGIWLVVIGILSSIYGIGFPILMQNGLYSGPTQILSSKGNLWFIILGIITILIGMGIIYWRKK